MLRPAGLAPAIQHTLTHAYLSCFGGIICPCKLSTRLTQAFHNLGNVTADLAVETAADRV